MKNNNMIKQHNLDYLKVYKAKYFFIGFIVAIIPYTLLLYVMSNMNNANNLPHFKDFILISGIVVSLINGIILKNKVNNKNLYLLMEK